MKTFSCPNHFVFYIYTEIKHCFYQIKIFNYLGKIVQQVKVNPNNKSEQIDVSKLVSGIYHLTLQFGDEQVQFAKFSVIK